jgi:hypothetical protein
MPCKVGYPAEPCPFGFKERVTRAACGACRNYQPPPHILAWCALYDREGTVCQRPKADCAQCPERVSRPPGRPKREDSVDWSDPKAVAAYHRKYAAEHPDKREQSRIKFMAKHPQYQATYYKAHAAKLKTKALANYNAKKAKSHE